MIRHFEGNLLDFKSWNVIAHCVNAQGVMGSGVAKAIRDEYPIAFEEYEKDFRLNGNRLALGTFSVAITSSGKRIVNMVAQEYYKGHEKEQFAFLDDKTGNRKFVDYEALYVCLSKLRDALEEGKKNGREYALGLPYKLASDRAGGDWKIVEAMIESIYGDSPIDVVIVKLPQK